MLDTSGPKKNTCITMPSAQVLERLKEVAKDTEPGTLSGFLLMTAEEWAKRNNVDLSTPAQDVDSSK